MGSVSLKNPNTLLPLGKQNHFLPFLMNIFPVFPLYRFKIISESRPNQGHLVILIETATN